MDTKPLERFATWARQELLTAVEAQATAVLKADSIARSERGGAVRALETEINRHGREHVIDKVAYTWFNRIIALRFMDARGYTGAGIVSPTQGQPHGQPEILADAKRGDIDTDVITSRRTVDAIIGLLDGTRRSTDAEGEAYSLLLTAYCHYWHGPMPFMFEREDNYTELLVPANLLADDAILSRALEVLTEDVCDDVEVIGWLYQFYISERKKEVFAGFSAKGEARKLAGPDEIPAATQLFTPHWIVRYLVENSLGRLWMLNHPDSQLIDQMEYYITPVDEEIDFLTITKPEELTVIDPACGSGHMLTYAFDLLYEIYVEEGYAPSEIPALILANNLYGTEIDPRAGALAAFALVMKARAKQRTFFNRQVEPNICVIERILFTPDELDFLITLDGDRHEEAIFWNQFSEADTFGSLIRPDSNLTVLLARHLETLDSEDLFQASTLDRAWRVVTQAEYLTRRYAAVVANPPYMGSGSMCDKLATFAKEQYRAAKSDLMTMFIERALTLTAPVGTAALVTRDAWMFLSRFTEFRTGLVQRTLITGLAHFGKGVFNGLSGAVVQTVGICVTPYSPGLTPSRGTYVQLTDCSSPDAKDAALKEAAKNSVHKLRFSPVQSLFSNLPGAPIAYWASEPLRNTFKTGRRIEDIAPTRQGFQTGDNDKFLRFWFEVSHGRINFTANSTAEFHMSGARFAPYLKGGGFRKWYGNDDYIVAFAKSDYESLSTMGNKLPSRGLYFKDSITWSALSDGAFGARYAGSGNTFSAKGACAFPQDDFSRDLVLAVFNSSVARDLLTFMGATLDFNVGSLKQLPIPMHWSDRDQTALSSLVGELVATHKVDRNSDETSPGFISPEMVERSAANESLTSLMYQIVSDWKATNHRVQEAQDRLDELVARAYGLVGVAGLPITLRNEISTETDIDLFIRKRIEDLVSYSIGCMFGRYSLNEPGLILSNQGASLEDYLANVPNPTLMPDKDNVIPIVDGDWFEDDIVSRFRQFLRAAFGTEHFEENLRFIEESLGVKTLRDYFITRTGRSKFYDDHVQRYKKRPIYWMFSSPKGSFNALIYLHRYTPSTVSTVLNEYLREYRGKLEIALQNTEREATGSRSSKAQKEADRIRKVIVELAEYEHDALYPLATQQVAIDLDDGVKVNYPKFGTALKKIKGLEAKE